MSRTLAAVFTLLLLSPATAGALTIELEGVLDGDQADAGNGTGSTATGTVAVSLDDETLEMTWSATFEGLLGDYTIAHFHGPALADESAGIQVGVSFTLDPDLRSGTGGGIVTISESQADDLVAGLWYLNVHSGFAGGGEIRGNLVVVPEPSGALLLCAGAVALLGLRGRRR